MDKQIRVIPIILMIILVSGCSIFLGTPNLGEKINETNNLIKATNFNVTFPINEIPTIEKTEGWYIAHNSNDEISIVKKGGVFYFQMIFQYNYILDKTQIENQTEEQIAMNFIEFEIQNMKNNHGNQYNLRGINTFTKKYEGKNLYGLSYIAYNNNTASNTNMYILFPFEDKSKFLIGHHSVTAPSAYYKPKENQEPGYLERFIKTFISANSNVLP